MMFKTLLVLPALLLALSPSASPTPADRCAELGTDGYPAHCSPMGERVIPAWGETLCCSGRDCVEPGPLGCPGDTELFACRYGEPDGSGAVACMYPVAHYCDEHECPAASELPQELTAAVPAEAICCYEEGCYDPGDGICGGVMYYCEDGMSNTDGTITCFDEDIPV